MMLLFVPLALAFSIQANAAQVHSLLLKVTPEYDRKLSTKTISLDSRATAPIFAQVSAADVLPAYPQSFFTKKSAPAKKPIRRATHGKRKHGSSTKQKPVTAVSTPGTGEPAQIKPWTLPAIA